MPPSIKIFLNFLSRKYSSTSLSELVSQYVLFSRDGMLLKKVKVGYFFIADSIFSVDPPHIIIGSGLCSILLIPGIRTLSFGSSLSRVFLPITIQSAVALK